MNKNKKKKINIYVNPLNHKKYKVKKIWYKKMILINKFF